MTLSLDALEAHLFKWADIIRDAVDPTDYKDYILPLVYYKTISDGFEKQYEQNVEVHRLVPVDNDNDEESSSPRTSGRRSVRGSVGCDS